MKNSKTLSITIIVLSLTVIFISVGYAAYSTILNINGIAKINKSVWSVHYVKDSINVLTGSDSGYALVAPTTEPTLNSTQTGVSFETELSINEETSFTLDVINDGTFNARVNSVNLKVASRTENEANYTTLANVSNNKWSNDYLDFYVVWTADGKNILDTVDFEPSTTKNMKVVVKYKQPDNQNLLPSQDMYFKFDIDVEYTQTSGLNQTSTVVPKITETVSSPVEFVDAIENTDEQVVVRLANDIDLSDYELIGVEGNIIIEFNGYRLTTAPNAIKTMNGGKLVLEDSTGEGGITADRGVLVVASGGTLIINGGKYVTTNYTRGSGINAKDGAKIILNNGIIDAAYYAIGSDGTVDVTINGGELNSTATSKNGTWAYSVSISNGSFTMNGGKITGVHGGLTLNGNTVGIINNGEIYVHESVAGDNDAYYNLFMSGGATLRVYDGLFQNDGTRTVIYANTVENIPYTGQVGVYGGKYIAKGSSLFSSSNLDVAGGEFSHDVSTFVTNGSIVHDDATNLYRYEA